MKVNSLRDALLKLSQVFSIGPLSFSSVRSLSILCKRYFDKFNPLIKQKKRTINNV